MGDSAVLSASWSSSAPLSGLQLDAQTAQECSWSPGATEALSRRCLLVQISHPADAQGFFFPSNEIARNAGGKL
jgi:hypothetical protein